MSKRERNKYLVSEESQILEYLNKLLPTIKDGDNSWIAYNWACPVPYHPCLVYNTYGKTPEVIGIYVKDNDIVITTWNVMTMIEKPVMFSLSDPECFDKVVQYVKSLIN